VRSAEAAVDERLKTAGRDINALGLRGLLLQRRGQFGEAARTLQAIIGIDARADWAYCDLIQLLLTHRRLADAEQVARAGVRANPDTASCHNAFGLILSEMNDLPSGEWHFRRALALGEPQAAYHMNLGLNLMKQGRIEEADGHFAEAHERAPADTKTLAYWSTLHEARGDLAKAQQLLDRAEAASSAEEVNQLRSNYLSRAGRHEDALATLNAARTLAGDAQLARGRLHDRLGQYEPAWRDFVEGKRKLATEAGGLQYRADGVEGLFGRFKEFFTRDTLRRLPQAPVRADMPQPIFIIGFPRSGTRLVEQILCSHSAVRAGGELPFLGELHKLATDLLPSSLPFPEHLAHSWTADRQYAATMFRDFYLARAAHHGLAHSGPSAGSHACFTDRMPFNEMYLPLLRMAFPQAKIIHVVRHPLDVCVSMLANTMTHGFNCGYRIEDITHHLAAMFDLLEHYRSQMDLGELVLRYESLVADQDHQTRKLLDHIGLPFEQATAKLNDHSINRHRHYARQLQSYASRLAGMMAAHGYS
jgi:tetratricopeptide (TPR) repeat protein